MEQRRPTRCRVERKLIKSNRGINGYGAGEHNLTPFGERRKAHNQHDVQDHKILQWTNAAVEVGARKMKKENKKKRRTVIRGRRMGQRTKNK